MKTQWKDVAHLYLGCQVVGTYNDASGSIGYLTGITNGGTECEIQFILEDGINVEEQPVWNETSETKPILRKLSSMTEEEAVDIAIIMYGQPDSRKWRMEDKNDFFDVYRKHCSESFTIDKVSGDIDRYIRHTDGEIELETTCQHHYVTRYLLSKGFDLWNLIENGYAIEKQ